MSGFHFVDLERDIDRMIRDAARERARAAGKGKAAAPLRSARKTAPAAPPVTLPSRCHACGAPMPGKRSQTRTCSARCRQKLSRDRRGLRPKPIGVVLVLPRARRTA